MHLLEHARLAGRCISQPMQVLQFFLRKRRLELAAYKRLMQDVDRLGFDRIRQRYISEDLGPANASKKYLDLSYHAAEVSREARRIQALGASRMHVLDLGSGTGLFLHLLRLQGHEVIGLDLEGNPIYDELIALLGIPRIVHRIEAFRGIPFPDEPFDLITAFSICFDGHASSAVWGIPEWEFFLDDCLRHLRHGGRLILNFNPATNHSFRFLPDRVANWMRGIRGAHLSENKETLVYYFDDARRAGRPASRA